ncbi:MAG: TetR/AcrR family transcriptional regulator [Pseudomonadota bacterium]
MSTDTREQLLDTAEALFAERGFYGVSIAAIADELGLTKQALLHHFGTKEKLYGEVLKRISNTFETAQIEARQTGDDPVTQLKSFLLFQLTAVSTDQARAALLMRELLDNKRRADTASTWYLKPFLESLVEMVQAVPAWANASEAAALATAYQLLGAINYYAVSGPTLVGIFGDSRVGALDAAFPGQFEALIDAALSSRS